MSERRVGERLATIETKVDNLTGWAKRIDSKVGAQNGRVNKNEHKITRIEDGIHAIRESISANTALDEKHRTGIDSWSRTKLVALGGFLGTIAITLLTFVLNKIWG